MDWVTILNFLLDFIVLTAALWIALSLVAWQHRRSESKADAKKSTAQKK